MFKTTKTTVVCLTVIILIVLLLLAIDCFRIANNEKPIFCLSFGQYLDGGTREYYGLGYKIIDYNILDGYKGFKIGTWFLKYDSNVN